MGKLHKNTNLDKASFLSTKQKEKELALEKAPSARTRTLPNKVTGAPFARRRWPPLAAIGRVQKFRILQAGLLPSP